MKIFSLFILNLTYYVLSKCIDCSLNDAPRRFYRPSFYHNETVKELHIPNIIFNLQPSSFFVNCQVGSNCNLLRSYTHASLALIHSSHNYLKLTYNGRSRVQEDIEEKKVAEINLQLLLQRFYFAELFFCVISHDLIFHEFCI